jgi:mannosyl-oligosaccharide glucosidase
MRGYGWDEYDIRQGGRQTIHDTGNKLDLTIDFIKVPGVHGGNWGVRVKGVPSQDASPEELTTIIFYAGLEGLGALEAAIEPDPLGFKGDVKFTGETPELGDFAIDVTAGPASNEHPRHTHPSYGDKPLDRTIVASLQIPPDQLWQTKGSSIPSSI